MENIVLKSSWATLNEYVSADAYNKLKEDILVVGKARGMIDNNNVNTTTGKPILIPADKTAGDIVKLQDIVELQNVSRRTIAYEGKNEDYDYKDPKAMSKPLALLYNEIRQIVIDMYTGASCSNGCSTACKANCSQTCYNACTTECADSNCSGYCLNTCTLGCTSGCKNECESGCTNINCKYEANDMCGADSCKSNCKDSCNIRSCASACDINCYKSCMSACGESCQLDTACTSTCQAECSNGCGLDNVCSSLVTGSNPMVFYSIYDLVKVQSSDGNSIVRSGKTDSGVTFCYYNK